MSDKFKATRQLLGTLRSQGVEPRIAFTSDDFALLVTMCRMGQGLTPVPVSRVGALATGGLVAIPLAKEADPGWQIDFVRRAESEPSTALAQFERYLLARAKDHAAAEKPSR